jgi:alpha-beta hydrolase superfamily lysophospholipase
MGRRLSILVLLACTSALACRSNTVTPRHIETAVPTDTTTVYVVSGDITLTGRLFGADHDTIVILTHMRQNDETGWWPFAQRLADEGFAALTFNFRGYDASGGEQDYSKLDEDLRAVIGYVQARRLYSKVFLVGASMGATTALVVAKEEDVAGVVAVSPPAQFDSQDALDTVPGVTVPKLLIASEEDAPALNFEELYAAAAEPKEEEIYPGIAHGTDLFDATKNPEAGSVEERILGFLDDLQ